MKIHTATILAIAIIAAVLVVGPVVYDTRTDTVRASSVLLPAARLDYLNTLEPLVGARVVDTSFDSETIIDATNKARIEAGLLPLQTNPELTASAKAKVEDMITKQYFEHATPEGRTVANFVTDAHYSYMVIGENLARGDFENADDVVHEWMKSPGHRANIINTKYQEIGAYAARGMYHGRMVWYAVQHFGTDRSVCPVLDTKLKATIDAMDKQLTDKRAQIANEKAILVAGQQQDDTYKERVSVFNELVASYNTTLVLYQEKSKVYNAQVTAFNACRSLYQ